MSTLKHKKQFGFGIINEVKAMVLLGKTQKEIAEFFGLKDKFVIKELLKRERRKENNIIAGIMPGINGRPRKSSLSPEQSKDNEIKRLKMEIELLRSFLQITGRK